VQSPLLFGIKSKSYPIKEFIIDDFPVDIPPKREILYL
jgi:hypothetical protein